MPNEQQVSATLTAALQPTHITVSDLSDGCGAKFEVLVVSEMFDGKALLERHRLVNGALSEEMKSIHALTIKTYTPAQWTKICAK